MNIDQLVEFYRCMGIQFNKEQHQSGPLYFATDLDGVVFEIYPAKALEDVDRKTRLGFFVTDLQAAMNSLRILRATIVEEPSESPWGMRAIVRDPNGRAVELYADETA